MCPGRAGDHRVSRMYGTSELGPLGLVATGASSRLPVCDQEAERVEERRGPAPLSRPEPSLHLSEVDTCRGECMAFAQTPAEPGPDRRSVPQLADEHRRVQHVDGQDASSVRRWARTHSLIDAWSLNWG
jgi:hypothetical protein